MLSVLTNWLIKLRAIKTVGSGKEVTVSGYVLGTSGSDGAKGYRLNLTDSRNDESERYVDCNVVPGDFHEEIRSKTVEVRGKIESVFTQNYLNMKRVKLESCELKK